MNYIKSEMIKEVKDNLSPKRFCHTMNVVSIAEKLGENYGLKGDEVFIAALYHDYAKEFSDDNLLKYIYENKLENDVVSDLNPYLYHGLVAAHIGRSKGYINTLSLYNAIRYHTTGYIHLDLLGKVIFVADAIEIGRNYQKVDFFRKLAFRNLDLTCLEILELTILFLKKNNKPIHSNSIEFKTYLLNLLGE
mgnify:CR=1 FL=1